MKKISILVLSFLVLLSCKEGENQVDQENSVDKNKVDESNLQPLTNMYGDDSIDASGNIVYGEVHNIENVTDGDQVLEEDLDYTLGTRPEHPMVNKFGNDSIDTQGNFVYPPRDTIWDEE